jgi:hypothetical protein
LDWTGSDIIKNDFRMSMGQDEIARCSVLLADELQLRPVTQVHLVGRSHDWPDD